MLIWGVRRLEEGLIAIVFKNHEQMALPYRMAKFVSRKWNDTQLKNSANQPQPTYHSECFYNSNTYNNGFNRKVIES